MAVGSGMFTLLSTAINSGHTSMPVRSKANGPDHRAGRNDRERLPIFAHYLYPHLLSVSVGQYSFAQFNANKWLAMSSPVLSTMPLR